MTYYKYPSRHMIERARSLRRDQTSPEELLWTALRNGQIGGLKFRRQHPIRPYVADFYCQSAKLAVEVDGMSHDGKMMQDAEKTAHLERLGVSMLRVTNDDVDEQPGRSGPRDRPAGECGVGVGVRRCRRDWCVATGSGGRRRSRTGGATKPSP